MGEGKKTSSEKLQRIIMDEEGEFPLSFCIKGKHDKSHQYAQKKNKTVSTAMFAKI